MFSAWTGSMSRPTMDIDLLGKIENRLETIVAVVKDACEIEVEDDGIVFHKDTVTATRITEDAQYKGVRVLLRGSLGIIRLFLQIDIGFGDVIIPKPDRVKYPVLLDFPPPELDGYTMESTIAEKFQAMVKLGLFNSRMKDFYDIWLLSRHFGFEGKTLAEAIRLTLSSKDFQNARNWPFFLASVKIAMVLSISSRVMLPLSGYLYSPIYSTTIAMSMIPMDEMSRIDALPLNSGFRSSDQLLIGRLIRSGRMPSVSAL